MKGTVLGFDDMTRTGVISGEDNNRYALSVENWKGTVLPKPGMSVDFVVSEDATAREIAREIYPAITSVVTTSNTANPLPIDYTRDSKKIPAALLAFFFGSFGVHKFYLGYTNAGIVMLLVYVLGFIFVLPPMAIWLISLVEFIIYITKSDEEFYHTYVERERHWF